MKMKHLLKCFVMLLIAASFSGCVVDEWWESENSTFAAVSAPYLSRGTPDVMESRGSDYYLIDWWWWNQGFMVEFSNWNSGATKESNGWQVESEYSF